MTPIRSWRTPVRFVSDVLAGVPSIVVGILGYELVVVPFGGYSGWAGAAAALAFIMIPIVARTTEEMLRLVPGSYREASIALGATKAGTILRVVIPSATGSLVTGAMLAIARVAGETAPLLFTAVGSPYLVHNPSHPFPSLTLRIYELSNEPSPKARSQAWSGILVLIALIFVVNLSVRYFTRQRSKTVCPLRWTARRIRINVWPDRTSLPNHPAFSHWHRAASLSRRCIWRGTFWFRWPWRCCLRSC